MVESVTVKAPGLLDANRCQLSYIFYHKLYMLALKLEVSRQCTLCHVIG